MVRLSIWTSTLLCVVAGCTSPAGDDDTTGKPDAATTQDAGGTPDGGNTPDSETQVPDTGAAPDSGIDFTRDPSCDQGNWIVLVNGRITDMLGGGVPAKAQVCIRLSPSEAQLCLRPADTRADGTYSILVPEHARCMERMVMRAVAPGTSRAASYCRIDISADVPTIDIPDPVVLYETAAPANLPPEEPASSPRAVTFVDGLEIDVTPDQFFGDYSMLASHRLGASDPRPCFLPQGEDYDGLYAFQPEQDIAGDGFPIRFPNDTGAAPGTIVDLYVLGGLFCKLPTTGDWLEEGRWENFGTATVSGDGTMIEGGSIPCLNWFGYRAR